MSGRSSDCTLSIVLRLEDGGDDRLRLCNRLWDVLNLSLVLAIADSGTGGEGDTGEPQSPTLSLRPPSDAVRYSSSEENSMDLGVIGVTGVTGLVTVGVLDGFGGRLLFRASQVLLDLVRCTTTS